MNANWTLTCALSIGALLGLCAAAAAGPNFESTIDRPLRYTPSGTDFVIANGPDCFNRPLYGGNTAFRIDAGDKPEFSFYLPGRGGNLRVGYRSEKGVLWLNDAKQITARYRPGSYVYEISDPVVGEMRITALALRDTDGLVLKIEPGAAGQALRGELIWAYGGVNGVRGARDGDIGTEKVSVNEYFQLKPEYAKDNVFTITGGRFTLKCKPLTMTGTSLPEPELSVTSAGAWASPANLLAAAGKATDTPLVTGVTKLGDGPAYVILQRLAMDTTAPADLPTYQEINGPATRPTTAPTFAPAYRSADLPKVFDVAEKQRAVVAGRLVVETPDAYINAAAAALSVAADGVWDENQSAFMHGAVAWRTKLLGWRGPYVGDELGQHDRTRRHLSNWIGKQNTKPIPTTFDAFDETANGARNEPELHSNGDMSNSHYDMNLVAIDVMFRHLLWTGDVEYAKKVWPTIERHLAWERRLFRRTFGKGDDALPLYEAYCAIWASDDLWYSGGGATHSSAYNYYHNKMAARVAQMIGQDPKPYQTEADLILKGMRRELWMADKGSFAEWKDLLGLQLLHPSIALWTFYHTVDSEVMTPQEAWQMSRYLETQIRRIPVKGPGVPEEGAFTMPTTNWFPYQWSTNNVVMGEAAHTALALWQTGRVEDANKLFKGLILDSMYLGQCPGNVGMATFYDLARNESQRDFSDGCGMVSRALVEGLFGIKPDLLAGEVVIRPGFPEKWASASISHADVSFEFRRAGMQDAYTIQSTFLKPVSLRLQLAALRDGVEAVTVNGQPVKWKCLDDTVGEPRIEIVVAPAKMNEIRIVWRGAVLPKPVVPPAQVGSWVTYTRFVKSQSGEMTWWKPEDDSVIMQRPEIIADWQTLKVPAGKAEAIDLKSAFNDNVTQIFKNKYLSPRSPFCSLAIPSQGYGSWCHPLDTFEVDDSGLRQLADKNGGKIAMPQGVIFTTPGTDGGKNIVYTGRWDNYAPEATVPLTGKSPHAFFLMAGSTHSMQSQFDNGEVIVTYADGSTAGLALRNPTTWWPIDQDYAIDDYQFFRYGPVPPRVDLKTGKIRVMTQEDARGKGRKIAGGAATVLDLRLDATKELKSLTVRTLSNEVVIGLMGVTLQRE